MVQVQKYSRTTRTHVGVYTTPLSSTVHLGAERPHLLIHQDSDLGQGLFLLSAIFVRNFHAPETSRVVT